MASGETEKVLSELSKQELKSIIKAAIKEWLDEQALNFGKWSLRWIAMAAFGGIIYFILLAQGWTHR